MSLFDIVENDMFDSTTTEELVIPVPEGATKFKTNIAGNVLTDNFYCYLQSGESVVDMMTREVKEVDDKIEVL